MADTKPKRRMGDRRDGRWVRDVPGLQTIMGHLMPNRTDAEVFMKDSFDVTELLPYLDAKNATHPDYKTTVFHALIMSVARMLKERPKMNYFIQGRRMYERYDISLSFVCKRRFQDNGEEALMFFIPKEDETLDSMSYKIAGEEALMFFIPKEDETLDSMSYKIAGEVRETRKSESSTDGIDALVDGFAKIPRVLLMGVIRVIRWMDFWGVNPKVLTDGDPNYSSVLLSNLGSIQAPAVYHHLNNYGTNSIMVTIGTIQQGSTRDAGWQHADPRCRRYRSHPGRAHCGRLLFCPQPETGEIYFCPSRAARPAAEPAEQLRLQHQALTRPASVPRRTREPII